MTLRSNSANSSGRVGIWGLGFKCLGSKRRSSCRHGVRGFHQFAFDLDLRLLIFPPIRAPKTSQCKKKKKKKKEKKKNGKNDEKMKKMKK